jgi:hypothetical protein
VAVGGEVHLVLHRGEEKLGGFGAGVVIDAGRVDVQQLAPEDLLRRPNVADAREQLVEVVRHAQPGRVLQADVVHREALDDVLLQMGRCPPAKLRAAAGTDPISHRDDHREAVAPEGSMHLPRTFLPNL